jgi:proline dehydrogenase
MTEPFPPDPTLNLQDTEIAFASRSNPELMKMDWLFSLMNNPGLNKLATNTLLTFIKWHLPIKAVVKYSIFNHFCGGETLTECKKNHREPCSFSDWNHSGLFGGRRKK